MANDLASLLASAAGNDTLRNDPALAGISPRLQLAQTMSQSGLDTSSVGHPLQALARVAQGAAGQYVQSGAMSDLAKAYAGQAEGAAKALEKVAPGHPLISALRSSDPSTQTMALRQAGPALMSLPQQQWEHQKFNQSQDWEKQKFNMQFNKPVLETTSTDPFTGQKGFVWATPANKGISPASMPAGAGAAGDPIAAARDAIAKGADRAKVIQRLQEGGINPAGL